MGTPTAAILIVTTAVTDGTKADHACISIGFVATNVAQSSTAQIASYAFSEDNQANSDTARNHNTTRCIRLPDHAGAGVTFLCEASFNSWITDGIRINWDALPSSAFKVTVILFGGSGLAAGLVTNASCPATINGTTTHTIGFEPQIIITTPNINAARELFTSLGVSDGTKNSCAMELSDFNSPSGNARSVCYNDRVHYSIVVNDPAPDTFTSGVALVNFTSTGFDAKTLDAAVANSVAALCLNFGGAAFAIDQGFTDPSGSGTGNTSYTWPGHKTGFLLVGASTTNTINTLLQSGGVSFGATDQQTSSAKSVHDEHGVGTTNTGSITDAAVVELLANDGTILSRATWVSGDANGFTLNWTTNPATARRAWALSVEEFIITGTGAGTLPGLQGAGAGTIKITGTGAGVLPNLQGAGAGTIKLLATGAGVLPGLAGAGAGTLKLTGTGAGVLPQLEGAGAATLKLLASGAGILPALEGAGAGTLKLLAAGAGVLPALEGAGAGTIVLVATGAGVLPALHGAGAGTIGGIITGSGDGVLPRLEGAGAATLKLLAAGAGFLPRIEGAGAGTLKLVAVGAGVLPQLHGSGAGTLIIIGTGAGILPRLHGSGSDAQAALALACKVLLEGSYVTVVELLGDHSVVAELLGDYASVVELEGGVC
jgi:hypothetical protein